MLNREKITAIKGSWSTAVASSPLARAFYSEVYASPHQPPNLARFQFLDPASYRFYPDRDLFADVCVAILEMAAEPGLTLTIYSAEPGSSSEEALRLLASWAASPEARSVTRPLPG